jgi:hypothetical protein
MFKSAKLINNLKIHNFEFSIYSISAYNLLKYFYNNSDNFNNVKNWKYNRPINKNRLEDIKNYIKNNECIEGIIYIYLKNDIFYVYDGAHRLFSLISIFNDTFNDFDDFIGFNFLKNINLIIDFIHFKEKSKDEIHDIIKFRFISINKQISVSELYTRDNILLAYKNSIDKILKYYQNRFVKAFKSPTATMTTQIPYIIQDKFIDYIDKVVNQVNDYRDNNDIIDLKLISYDNWLSILSKYNNIIKENLFYKYSKFLKRNFDYSDLNKYKKKIINLHSDEPNSYNLINIRINKNNYENIIYKCNKISDEGLYLFCLKEDSWIEGLIDLINNDIIQIYNYL